MDSKYQYEKILTTLNEQDFSKSSFESLFDNLEFSSEIPQHKQKFVDDNILVTWLNYESTSYPQFKDNCDAPAFLSFLDCLTYDMTNYADYAKTIVSNDKSSGNTDNHKDHIKNFHPYSVLNRINYYLNFITYKIKTLDSYARNFFNGKSFSLNSCPTYPLIMQQTLTLSQFDKLAIKTQNVMLDFIKTSIENAFLGRVAPEDWTFDTAQEKFKAKLDRDSTYFSRGDLYDRTYRIGGTGQDVISLENFLNYVIPNEVKDTKVKNDFYLQLQATSRQDYTDSLFARLLFDEPLCDWKSSALLDETDETDDHRNVFVDIHKYCKKSIINLSDVLFFLSNFIDKLSHVKSFSILWKHLQNTVETEFHAMSTLTINYVKDDGSFSTRPNHALYITTVISPIHKRMNSITDSNEQMHFDMGQDNFDTNILLVNSNSGIVEDEQKENLFDTLIYDNEEDDIGNIDDELKPDIGQFFNTNGIFGSQYFVQRKNNFKLTLDDVREKFNLYKGQVISRKSVLQAIDYIFNIWTMTMSTYTLHIVTCHSNCHMNYAVIQKKIDGNLDVTRTVSDSAELSRDYCYCGSVLKNTMTITKYVPDYISRDYDITTYAWTGSITLSIVGGTLNYNTRPEKLTATLSYKIGESTKTQTAVLQLAANPYPHTFTIPDDDRQHVEKISVKIEDVDSACGVKEKDYNEHWRYTKTFRITGQYKITGTLKNPNLDETESSE